MFLVTEAVTQSLSAIEVDRRAVQELPIDVPMLASLRESAKLLTAHYSTQIEGNRLTQQQVREVIAGTHLPGRERDEAEVRHYYAAIEFVEREAERRANLTERQIQAIHGLVMFGKSAPTAYRDGQNVIRDSSTGGIVYMPPEAKDVAPLMGELVTWINAQLASASLPVPIIAACAHYQFATIHPYYDGNGRTARLLTTLILHLQGYGLKGIYSLEEYYARDLASYYRALSIGPSHNYYLGRAEADITQFVAYFTRGMADAFAKVRARADQAASRGATDHSMALRELDPRLRRLLPLFRRQGTANVTEMATHLALSPRTLRPLCTKWVEEGFLEISDESRRNRTYRLTYQWAQITI
jgi:Fic family protein